MLSIILSVVFGDGLSEEFSFKDACDSCSAIRIREGRENEKGKLLEIFLARFSPEVSAKF